MADDNFEVALIMDAGPAAPAAAAAISMFRGIVDVLQQAQDRARQLGEETSRMRDSLRDVAALSGRGGVTNEFIQQHLGLIKATGFTAPEAHDYAEQFLGEAEVYRGKMAAAGDFEKLMTMSGQYGLVKGAEPGTMAKLAGRLLGMAPQGATAGGILGEEAEFFRVIGLGSGVTSRDITSLVNVAPKLVGAEGKGMIGSMRNLAALGMGASRLGSEYTIDTTLEQFSKGVMGYGPKPWQEFIKNEIGTREGMKVEDAMNPLFDWMEQQQAAGRDLHAVLLEKGLDRTEMRGALIGMLGQRKEMGEVMAGKIGEPMTPAMAQEDIENYYAAEGGKKRLADAELLAARTEVGMKHETRNRLFTLAQAQLTKEEKIGPEMAAATAFEDMMLGKVGTSTEKMLINERMRKLAGEEFGISPELAPPPTTGTGQALAGVVTAPTRAVWSLAGDNALISGTEGRARAEADKQRMAQWFSDPARIIADVLTAPSRAIGSVAGENVLVQGGQFRARVEADRQKIESGIREWQGGVDNSVQSLIQQGKDAKEIGFGGGRSATIMGRTGEQWTPQQFEEDLRGRGMSEPDIHAKMLEILDRFRQDKARPLAVASKSEGAAP